MTATATGRAPASGQAATVTVPSRVRRRAYEAPDRVALRHKHLGIWQEITWRVYWEQVELVGHGLLALGIRPGDRVAIHAENRPEWLYADVACSAIRAVSVGLYPTNPPAEVAYLLADSGASVLLAEDQEQVDKALEVKAGLPDLRRIVYMEPRGVRQYDDPELLSWADLLELGRRHRAERPGLLDELGAKVGDDDVVTLLYTSGTTGPPKGAMLTVANVNFAIRVLVEDGGFFEDAGPSDVTLSYLPMCHVAERIATEWENAAAGTQVHFAESIDTVQQDLREVQPTLFFAVPRIWEKIRATVEIRMASASRLKRANYRFWMRQAERIGAELVANGGTATGDGIEAAAGRAAGRGADVAALLDQHRVVGRDTEAGAEVAADQRPEVRFGARLRREGERRVRRVGPAVVARDHRERQVHPRGIAERQVDVLLGRRRAELADLFLEPAQRIGGGPSGDP